MHVGQLNIDGLKMSKRLKNFTSIRAILEGGQTASQIRIMFLLQKWDRVMQYSDEQMNIAERWEAKYKNFAQMVRDNIREQEKKVSNLN